MQFVGTVEGRIRENWFLGKLCVMVSLLKITPFDEAFLLTRL